LLAVPFLLALLAAGRSDTFDYNVANMQVLQSRAVQKDMGVTGKQRAKMNSYAADNRTKLLALENEAKKSGKNPDTSQFRDMYVALRSKVFSVLTTGQLKRLREITLQIAGAAGLLDQNVADKVGLTKDQLDKGRKIYQDGMQREAKLSGDAYQAFMKAHPDKPKDAAGEKRLRDEWNARGKKLQPELLTMHSETDKKVIALLSKAQMAKWKALKGKPFKR